VAFAKLKLERAAGAGRFSITGGMAGMAERNYGDGGAKLTTTTKVRRNSRGLSRALAADTGSGPAELRRARCDHRRDVRELKKRSPGAIAAERGAGLNDAFFDEAGARSDWIIRWCALTKAETVEVLQRRDGSGFVN